MSGYAPGRYELDGGRLKFVAAGFSVFYEEVRVLVDVTFGVVSHGDRDLVNAQYWRRIAGYRVAGAADLADDMILFTLEATQRNAERLNAAIRDPAVGRQMGREMMKRIGHTPPDALYRGRPLDLVPLH